MEVLGDGLVDFEAVDTDVLRLMEEDVVLDSDRVTATVEEHEADSGDGVPEVVKDTLQLVEQLREKVRLWLPLPVGDKELERVTVLESVAEGD